jgi:hypothetical protein
MVSRRTSSNESPCSTSSAGTQGTPEAAAATTSPALSAGVTSAAEKGEARIYTGNLTRNPIIHGVDSDDWTLDDYRRDLAGLPVPGWEPETEDERDARLKAAVDALEARARKEVSQVMKMKPYNPDFYPGMNMANLTKRPRYVPMIALGERSAEDMVFDSGWVNRVQAKEVGKQVPAINEKLVRADLAAMGILPLRSRAGVARRDAAELGEHNVVEGRRKRRKVDKDAFPTSPSQRSNSSYSTNSASSDGAIDEVSARALPAPKAKVAHRAPKASATPRSSKKRPTAAMDAGGIEPAGQSAPTLPSYRLVAAEETEEEQRKRLANAAKIQAMQASYKALETARRATEDD